MYNITHEEFLNKCKEYVYDKEEKRLAYDEKTLSVFVIWSGETSQEIKAILSASNHSSYMYEASLDREKDSIYIDMYKKTSCDKLDVNKDKNHSTIKNSTELTIDDILLDFWE